MQVAHRPHRRGLFGFAARLCRLRFVLEQIADLLLILVKSAVIGRRRLAALPDVPTMTELGLAGFDSGLWFGLNAPAGTPPAVIERLNAEARRAFGLAEVKAQLAAQGIEAVPGTAEAFAAFYRGETDKWARVVRESGTKAD